MVHTDWLGCTPFMRSNSRLQQALWVADGFGVMVQALWVASGNRVCLWPKKNAVAPLCRALMANRRVSGRESFLMVVTTTATAGERNAVSTAQRSSCSVLGLIKIQRSKSSPVSCSKRKGAGHASRPIQSAVLLGAACKSVLAKNVGSVAGRKGAELWLVDPAKINSCVVPGLIPSGGKRVARAWFVVDS